MENMDTDVRVKRFSREEKRIECLVYLYEME